MPRGLIKTGIAAALHYSGADRLLGPAAAADSPPLILGYHRVVEDFEHSARRTIPAMLVSVRTLERHIDRLGRRYEFVSLDEAAVLATSSRRRRRPAAALTFDDGYRDVYENALPLLQRKGIPAAVFLVTDLTGTGRLLLHDELYLLIARSFRLWPSPQRGLGQLLADAAVPDALRFEITAAARTPYDATRALMTLLPQQALRGIIMRMHEQVRIPQGELDGMAMMDWEMADAMRRAGHVIGSHTRTHAYLTNEEGDAVADEVRGSRAELQRRLGTEPIHFAYPNGDFNPTVARAAADAGYAYAYTTCTCRGGVAQEMAIPRRMVWERSGFGAGGRFSPAVFECETRGVFDVFSGCRRERHA